MMLSAGTAALRADQTILPNGDGIPGLRVEHATPDRGRNGAARLERRRRRILLATASQRLRRDLAQALTHEGHEVLHTTSHGLGLLAAVEQGGGPHAIVLSQGFLGAGWPALVRQLRRRAPRVPIVLLLRPGAEWAWRFAFLAGAFDALPASADLEAVLGSVHRALTCPTGRDPDAAARSRRPAEPRGASSRVETSQGGPPDRAGRPVQAEYTR
jgi:DNA-binding NtrC family response regulator